MTNVLGQVNKLSHLAKHNRHYSLMNSHFSAECDHFATLSTKEGSGSRLWPTGPRGSKTPAFSRGYTLAALRACSFTPSLLLLSKGTEIQITVMSSQKIHEP